MLTPSNLKKHTYPYNFSLHPGETKEQYSKVGDYAVRATREGNTVYIYKKFAIGNFYKHKQLSYNTYMNELNKPINNGSLIEAF